MAVDLTIDVRLALPRPDGLGNYTRETVPRIISRLPGVKVSLLCLPAMATYWSQAAPTAELDVIKSRPMWPGQQLAIPLHIARHPTRVLFYPAHDPPVLAPCKLAFTIPDLSQLQVAGFHENLNWLKTSYTRAIVLAGLRRAQRVFAISESTKRAVGEIFGANWLGRVIVTPLGAPDVESSRDSDGSGYFLYVGTDRPHKNLDRLLVAYADARKSIPGLPPLRIVGQNRRPARLRERIENLQLTASVSVDGPIDDTDLEQAYGGALALVMPSLREGFGLPILEAMQRGVPVITSSVSATAEVAGTAALTVDPYDVRELTAALVRVAMDPTLRADLSVRGVARARDFSWERCAEITATSLAELL
jgi:glycosyltransferase involved in cell wall biosynthesis